MLKLVQAKYIQGMAVVLMALSLIKTKWQNTVTINIKVMKESNCQPRILNCSKFLLRETES